MAQLMPLPLTVFCFSKIQIGFTFLVPAHPGSLGKSSVKRVCVCSLLMLSVTSCLLIVTAVAWSRPLAAMVWCGMVNVDLYSAIITKVSNALNTLVPGEKIGFQCVSTIGGRFITLTVHLGLQHGAQPSVARVHWRQLVYK